MKFKIMTVNGQVSTLLFCWLLSNHIQVKAAPCYLNATSCVAINTSMCLTTKVTFSHTSLIYTNTTLTQEQIMNDLEVWKKLKGVPECWSVIQPFLCSVYLPKCKSGSSEVERPNQELCERVRSPCEVVKKYNGKWPWFLQCDQWFYAESCGQTVYETSNFDTVSECSAPLIHTESDSNWYDKIKGCGVQCENPLYTDSEHSTAHIVVAILAGFCLFTTSFTLVTFLMDWKVSRKYPTVILFYINGCFLIATLGWLAQFINRDDVVCRKDGTIRKGEPLIGSGESASCTVVFVTIYYFMMSGIVWFVMLAYSWDIHFKALGTVRDDLSKKTAYFHIISWCLPLVLTIMCLSISVIDADSLSGVCFPGFYDSWNRAGFVLAPIILVLIIGAVFSIRGLLTLIKVKKDSPPFIGEKATSKIHDTIIRLGIFIALTFVLVIISTCIHVYTFVKQSGWNSNMMDYTYCKANVSVMEIFDGSVPSSCEMENRPSIVAAIIHIFSFFGAGILFSSWSWSKASLDVWERVLRRLFNKPSNKPQKLRKHRLVARAFKRRKQRTNERLSVSYGTEHDDPFGMRFDRSSASSHSQSSGFAMTVPKHNRRQLRGLMRSKVGRSRHRHTDPDAVSLGSKVSSSQRASSRSSRRRSYESSMSQKLSDIEREIRAEERRKRRKKRRKKRQNRVQPIMEPISSSLAALQAQRSKQLQKCSSLISESSDVSELNGHIGNIGNKALIPMHSLGSSNILSDSVMTGNSISEIELPQTRSKQPDLSIFTAQAALPPTSNRNEKEDNSNGNVSNLKGANPSPSGSYRRGRRREVKLEMTETSFYQEDDDNIEIGGNQTIHTEENCQESGEIRGNLKELGPLVNEIFEQARAGSRNSSQTVGSSRLGSASSRGSKGSQSNSKDQFRYANTKVHLPPEKPKRNDTERTERKRPFSGDYVLTSKRNMQKRDEAPRKSQSQPSSRVSSAVGHKRQIGQNGKLDFTEGLNWSRFLQGKGHTPGPMFGPSHQPLDKTQRQFYQAPVVFDKHQGQLKIMDKSHFEKEDKVVPGNVTSDKPVAVVAHVGDESNAMYELRRPYTNPYRRYQTTGDVLPDENDQDEDDSGFSSRLSQTQNGVNILNVEAEHCRLCGAHKAHAQNVDVLNIQAEQVEENPDQPVNLDVLNVEAEHRTKPSKESTGLSSPNKNVVSPKNCPNNHKGCNLLVLEAGHINNGVDRHNKHLTKDSKFVKNDVDNSEHVKGDVLGNIHHVNADVHRVDESFPKDEKEKVTKLMQEPARPHTGPGPAKDDADSRDEEVVSAFSGVGDRKKNGPNKVKTLASIPTENPTQNQATLKSVPTANTNILNLEQIRQQHLLKKRKLGSQGSLSSGSRSASANTGSASIRNSRVRQQPQAKITIPGYDDKKSNDKKTVTVERNLGMFDFIDYEEFNSEYDDITTDDLTDTYTCTSYEDDLTEVSSLPC